MCGIAGIFSNKPVSQLDLRIGNMCNAMVHRGPNAAGITRITDKVALGHSRLSIIDLNYKSNQPMLDNSGRFYLSFNGEIVNFEEIKKELNYHFVTNSDTEVILAAIQQNGINWFLDKANGMFGFILYDTVKETVIIARDHMGIKPILYTIANGILIVASEVRAILNSGLVEAKLNKVAVDDYLGYRYVREPYTFFEGILQVTHGSYIEFDKDLNATTKVYYKLPNLNFSDKYDEDELIDYSRIKLEQVMKRWSVSDVKIGSYLSGGVDSSLLTAMMAKTSHSLDTYTIGFDDEKTNEFTFAQMVADRYKTNHKAFLISMDDYTDEWDRLIWYKGAPLGVPNEIPLSIMTSKLSRDITVVISGEGADELFGGYGRIFRSAFEFENGQMGNDFYSGFIDRYEYVPRSFRDKYLVGDFRQYRHIFDDNIRKNFKEFRNEENIFRFFHTYHIQGLLQRLDACTMQASVESRPPFLDHELIDFVYKEIPYDLKLKWNSLKGRHEAVNKTSHQYSEILDTPKYILKKIAEHYLPIEIIYRKKMGFPVPLTDGFDSLVKIASQMFKGSEWLNIQGFDEFIKNLQQLNISGQVLWMLLNVEKFKRIYLDKEWRY